jgi:rare lipoprotein A
MLEPMRIRNRLGSFLRAALILTVVLTSVYCVRRTPPPRLDPGSAGAHELVGIASWYGGGFQGRPTSSREIYDMFALTAAHKTLPFDTRVRVVNQANGRSAAVRINDRGPFVDGRIIDLSLAAARAIGMEEPGTAPVRLEILSLPNGLAVPSYSVQAGSYLREESARKLAARLKDGFGSAAVIAFDGPDGRTFYRVSLPAADRTAAALLARRLGEAGFPALVVEGRR